MAVHLQSKQGKTFKTTFGHWEVFLSVAECFGWKKAGTDAPANWADKAQWHGRYDSADGQTVNDQDAKELARILHSAAAGPHINQALNDVIKHVESAVETQGINIPQEMRMKAEDFNEEFSPLLFLLYDGEFSIN